MNVLDQIIVWLVGAFFCAVHACTKGLALTSLCMVMLAVQGVHHGGAMPLIPFRKYQEPIFWDHSSKILVIHWSRQIGKSYTLASWAVDRLLRYPGRLVTVLSNSRDNGAEFVVKVREVCEKLGQVIEQIDIESNAEELDKLNLAEDLKYEMMRFEVRIKIGGREGRIKVLAANPRTARGFSGDLILDEFAFHEDSRAIWDAAEPIISSNKDYLCRIASTGNGRRNMFYQLCTDGRYRLSSIRRSDAWKMGEIKIYSAVDGREITPDEARAESVDKRSYDQNYENSFEDENMPLLTTEMITEAEKVTGISIDRQAWSPASVARMYRAENPLYAGYDFARSRDLSVITVFEKIGRTRRIIAMLVMEGMRISEQGVHADTVCQMPRFVRICVDMTGNGLGAFERLEEKHGSLRVEGVNFSTSEAVSDKLISEGRKSPTAKVTELMAIDLVAAFEDHTVEIFAHPDVRDDLRKPEKIVSPGGRVSIAAARDAQGHADMFWSIALSYRASSAVVSATPPKPGNRGGERSQARREAHKRGKEVTAI